MRFIVSDLRADCKLKTVNPPTNSGPTQPPKLLDQVAGNGVEDSAIVHHRSPLWPNDCVHLPGRMLRLHASESRHGGPVKCNALFGDDCYLAIDSRPLFFYLPSPVILRSRGRNWWDDLAPCPYCKENTKHTSNDWCQPEEIPRAHP